MQDLQVFRNRRLRQVECVDDLGHRAFVVGEKLEDVPAARLGHGVERVGDGRGARHAFGYIFLYRNMSSPRNAAKKTGAALLLQPPDLLLDVLDLRLDLPDLLRDLLCAFAVAGLSGRRQRVMQPPQFLLEPRQLVSKLSQLSAVLIAGRLFAASRLSGSSGRLRRDVCGRHTNESQSAESCEYPSHGILHMAGAALRIDRGSHAEVTALFQRW